MKTLKVMSIVSLIISILAFLCIAAWEFTDPMAAIGWGVIEIFYTLAFAIVVLVIASSKTVIS